jgi:hypothetical protein
LQSHPRLLVVEASKNGSRLFASSISTVVISEQSGVIAMTMKSANDARRLAKVSRQRNFDFIYLCAAGLKGMIAALSCWPVTVRRTGKKYMHVPP